MENNKWPASRVVFYLLLIGVALAAFYFSKTPKVAVPDAAQVGMAEKTSLAAQISFVQGAVEYKEDNNEWKRAIPGIVLKQGDAVEVIGSGRAVVNLTDGSALRLDNNSALVLTNLDSKNVLITNVKGKMYARTVKEENRVFTVKEGVYAYQSADAAYTIVNGEKLQGVEVYNSQVKISGDGGKEILVNAGDKYYVMNKDNKALENKPVKIIPEEIKKDQFAMWNKAEDLKVAEYKDAMGVLAEPAATVKTAAEKLPEAVSAISLTGYRVAGGIQLNWKTNLKDEMGFKVIRSTEVNPVYPGDEYAYLSDPGARSYKWEVVGGEKYYFRVCEYTGDKCGAYSNNLVIYAPAVKTVAVPLKSR